MATRNIVKTATLTFSTVSYELKSVTAGEPKSNEPIDVTVLSDTDQIYVPGALTMHGEITAVIACTTTAPTAGTQGALSISLGVSANGGTATTTTVSIPSAILKSVEPATAEAGGNRELTYTCVFQPTGLWSAS